MRKILAATLTFSIFLTACVPVFAADTVKIQRLLETVKERIEDTTDFENFSSETNNSNGKVYYSFYWGDEDSQNHRDMSLTVDDKGIITNYHYYDNNIYSEKNKPSIKKMPIDEVLAKTKELVKILNPDIYANIKIEKTTGAQSLYSDTYDFLLKRIENDIEVYQDTGYVTVNSDATKIISFNLNYTDTEEIKEHELIDTDAAWKSFFENAGMELKYHSKFEDGKISVYPVYTPLMKGNQYIDAVDGKLYDIVRRRNGNSISYSAGAMNDAAKEESQMSLSQYEKAELERISGLISEADAEKKIRSLDVLDFYEKLELFSVQLNKSTVNDKEEYFYSLNFRYEGEEYKYANATINAKTAELINWSSSVQYTDKTLEGDELVEAANNNLSKISPRSFDDNDTDGFRINESNSGGVSYTRYVNGIPFENDTARIRINPENKKVTSFSLSYTDVEFPSIDGVISQKEAAQRLSELADLKLYYIPTYIDEKTVAKAGYKLENLYYCTIDAFSGKLVYDNKEEKTVLEYSDISGHYAQKAIKTLALYGIGFEAGEMMPDKLISQKEFATLLVSTFIRHYPVVLKENDVMLESFKRAQNNDIIRAEDGNPDDVLTREKAAVYIIRAMGAEQYAQLSKIYKPMFSDVKNYVGYISLLSGMGVVNGDGNGKFNPNANLTRADAIMLIYNYLSR